METDPALLQGVQLRRYTAGYIKSATDDLAMLQISSSPGIQSYVEGLDQPDSTNGAARPGHTGVSETEREFNEALLEYSTLYRQFSQDVLRDARTRGPEGAAGSVVSDSDGHYSYVNDFGFTHRYSTIAWEQNSPTCPSSTHSLTTEELDQLRAGPPMGLGQACGVAGKNVQDGGAAGTDHTGEVAWVDAQGYRHVYSSDVWESKAASCDIPVVTLTAKEYAAIPDAGAMLRTTSCEPAGLEPDTWRQLQALNARLVELARELGADLDALAAKDDRLEERLRDNQQLISQYVDALGEDQAQIASASRAASSAAARQESTSLQAESRWAHYLVWAAVAVAVVALVAHALFNGPPGAATTTLAVVGAILMLYMGISWLHRHIYFR